MGTKLTDHIELVTELACLFPYYRYQIMRSCWLEDPNSRPSFKDLMKTVDDILAQSVEYLELHVDVVAIEGAVNWEHVDMVTDSNAPLHLCEPESTDDKGRAGATGGKDDLYELPGDLDLYD